jgi:uncharacterized protein DUF4338
MSTDSVGDRQLVFMRSLEADLRLQGINLNSLPDSYTPSPQADYQGRRLRVQNGEPAIELSRHEDHRLASSLRLQPQLHFCQSAADNRLYESLRLLQRVPSGRRLGRQLRVLVYDSAQPNPALVGAIGLASPLYRLGSRDRHLGWASSSSAAIRHFGLRRTMDLAVCVSTPAYAGMRVSKLLAMISVSAPLAEHYASRYDEPLLAVITTCASGSHCACFNRIMIRPGGLFRKVGETAGYTTSHFSNATIKAARELVLGSSATSDVMRSSAEALPVLRTAMKRLKLPHERLLRMGVHKAVYVAECYPGALTALRSGDSVKAGAYLTLSEAVEFWRSRISVAGVMPDSSNSLRVGTSNASD